MRRDEAETLIQEFLAANQLGDPDLEDEDPSEGAAAEWKPGIDVAFDESTGTLKLKVPIHQFEEPLAPEALEACEAEARRGVEMGGGTLEYDPEDQNLYLTRSYTSPVPLAQLTAELQDLQDATDLWAEDLLFEALDKARQG
jgi:hypothetical protein